MARQLDLNSVTVLAAVVELQSFRGAAKGLGIPRSTVSSKVAELERQLGARLLERTTRVVRATEAGRAYLEAATPALRALIDAGRVLADLEGDASGLLRITAPPELGQFLFGPVFAAYLKRCPAVTIEAQLTSRRVDMVTEGFDLAVRAGELPDSSLIARTIGPAQGLSLCASPSYLRRRGVPRVPRDLRKHDCLAMSDRQEPRRWEFRRGRARMTVVIEPRSAINSFLVLRDLAVAGNGVTWLPQFLAREPLRDGSLRELLARFRPPACAYHALYPRSRASSQKLRTFVEVLAETGGALLA